LLYDTGAGGLIEGILYAAMTFYHLIVELKPIRLLNIKSVLNIFLNILALKNLFLILTFKFFFVPVIHTNSG